LITAAVSLLVSAAAFGAPPSIVPVRDVELPANFAIATDVRWATDKSIYVSNFQKGVSEINLVAPSKSRLLLAGGRSGPPQSGPATSMLLSEFLGVSKDYLVVGSPLRQIAWKARNGAQFMQEVFSTALDVDALNDRAVVLGVRGDAYGRWGSVGATLWLASMTPDHMYFEPVSAVPVESIHKCGFPGIGAVRFYPDGRFVAVAGVQPGASLYDQHGKLIREWRTDDLGIDDRCTVTDAQADAFADSGVRAEWMKERRVVDEVLPLPEGPLLIIRERRGDRMTWRGMLLPFDGKPFVVPIPLSSPSMTARLHADLRGDRIVFLLSNLGSPATPPARVILAHVAR